MVDWKKLTLLHMVHITLVQAQTPGWPQWDQPPPITPEYTSMISNMSIPQIPVRPQAPVGSPPACTQNPCGPDCGCWWTCGNCVRPDDIIACPQPKVWGLTFDDGPSTNTTFLLDYLKQQNLKAMFCVIGSRVVEYPEILKRAYSEGHELCSHTWSHRGLTTQSNEQVIAEMKWTEKAIFDTIGVIPKYMRPPFGDIDDRVRGIVRSLGYKVVLWDMDTSDWKLNDPNSKYNPANVQQTFRDFLNTRAPTLSQGVISLEHDLRMEGGQQFPIAMEMMKTAGYARMSVGQGLIDPNVDQDQGVGTKSGKLNGTTTKRVLTWFTCGLLFLSIWLSG
ncbi:chitin deacetylase [Basidiobolus ranarum]|uniref:Chitin deacetylase n=1 Tax=Basidiobolus ranarum TaxID=34480 RepID=A0ABR2WUS3_9FUNG